MLNSIAKRIRRHLAQQKGSFFSSSYGKLAYSQEGEDVLLSRILGHTKNSATYVDVGCNHPVAMSNTALFYQAGWRGVAVDPNPVFASLFRSYRPEDIFFNCGVGKKECEMIYFTFEESLYNTFDSTRAQIVAEKHSRLVDKRTIPVRTLASILNACWPQGHEITLLSVDCEGLDGEVLESHDFERYPVEFAYTEIHTTTVHDATAHPIAKYLSSRQFVFISKLCSSCLFVHKDALSKYGL